MSDSKDAFCSHVNVSLDLWTPSLGTVGGGGDLQYNLYGA